MAIVKGTNAGFLYVGTSPSADPSDSSIQIDTFSYGVKDTAPTGATKVTEIGWYCNNATQEANFEVGIYDNNVGDDNPEAVVGALSQTNAKGTGAGWKKVTGLNIAITAGTIYWIAVQVDDTATGTNTDKLNDAGERTDRKNAQTTLTDPWAASDSQDAQIMAFYAVTDAEPVSARTKVEMLGSC